MRKALEQVKGKDFETVRLILLAKNFVFNQEIKFIKTEKNEEIRQKKFDELSKRLKLPKDFAHTYAIYKKPLLKDLEARQSIYYVYGLDESKKIIDEDGIYIKFDPQKTDNYYKRLIKQLRALFAFLDASEQEKELYFKKGGHSTFHFLDNKKAKTPRHQHGSNFKKDISTYLMCEKSLEEMFTTSTGIKDEGELMIKHAIEFATENLGLDPYNSNNIDRVKRIYYEVCSRYKLPTLTKDPIFF